MKGKFNIKRIWLLMNATVRENFKNLLYEFGMIYLVIGAFAFMTFVDEMKKNANIEELSFFEIDRELTEGLEIPIEHGSALYAMVLVLTVAVSIVAYSLFKCSVQKKNQLYKATLPASIIEKYTANVILAFSTAPILLISLELVTNVLLSVIFKIAYGVEIVDGGFDFATTGSLQSEIIISVLIPLYVIAFFIIIPILNTDVISRIDRFIHIFIVVLGFAFPAVLVYLLLMSYNETALLVALIIVTLGAWIISYYSFKRREIKR